jgi:enoyl-CoA hydratase
MPETGIGLFPDVGATFFLPRLPGSFGTYLALTGARLGQADLEWCGIATHPIRSDSADRLVDDLAEDPDLDAVCARHAHPPKGPRSLSGLVPVIDRCFGADSVQGIVTLLKQETGEHAEWAAGIATSLQARSPISLHIALRQMREGRTAEFDECMRIEFRIVNRVLLGSDFHEGVRAVIIDKDNRPRWSHPNLDAVSPAEVAGYFAPLGRDELDFA